MKALTENEMSDLERVTTQTLSQATEARRYLESALTKARETEASAQAQYNLVFKLLSTADVLPCGDGTFLCVGCAMGSRSCHCKR